MAWLLPSLLVLGCVPDAKVPLDTASPADTDRDTDSDTDTDTDTDSDTDTDTDSDTDTEPVDLDGDGSPGAEDCDDTDPDVFPGAPEHWNELDDDCDGHVDADGAWTGSVRTAASAVYEGRRYNFLLDCRFAGTRTDGELDFTITCTPDPGDEDAQRLLGATLVVTPKDRDVDGDRWEDTVEFTSANGWDSDGDGEIAWSDFDRAEVEVTMSGVSLTATGSGDIARE